ncbi:Transposase [Phytophthora palmivora]|uniref:Transposase n=1 Tax=Phytophthora palmivora TaxID=4796 RepID=A0A2P4YVT9_9STRA|nr:Transposase [Phytophthora palmivora]
MDNYYTSVQLLLDLQLKGLCGRGTVRGGSKHFPKHTILQKEESNRGDHQQAVAIDHKMLAVSCCDGNILTMVTNADASTTSTVIRRVGNESRQFRAPTCILEYNRHMQGVDRLDQLRTRFSLADGHFYKRWHKKLALALVDMARTNAYLSRRMAIDASKDRDPHRTFLTDLVGVELQVMG